MKIFDRLGFNKLKDGLNKTKAGLFGKINTLINSRKKIDDEFLNELEEILLLSDMGVETSENIISNVKQKVKQRGYETEEDLRLIVKKEIENVFINVNSEFEDFNFNILKKPYVIMVVGVNGVGKTTSIGKLAYNFKKAGKSVLIGSADTFRAAANDQLEIWARRAGVDIIQSTNSKDPASVAYETVSVALRENKDVAIIDTAGRLHNKAHLMEELKKIKRVMQKVIPEIPNEIFLVIDATTGQNALTQAEEFSKALGKLTGIILTKLDGTAKGGIILKINRELNIPVRFIGVGEQIDDLQKFESQKFTEALFADE